MVDQQKGLPDNVGQPVGSGEKVWFVESCWSEPLGAQQRSGDRYS
ncbi:hypothetical protein [Reticulibacter mediterranei]|nr:hypothetical protein [Reticulibacter mediterranei]